MNESDSDKESIENASSSETSGSSDCNPKRKHVLVERPCFESASTTTEEEGSNTGASSEENHAVERKQICDRSSISTSEKESSRNSEEPTESEAHCHVPDRTRSSEHSGLLLSSEKELSSDSEVISISSIEEDFNYSINRFCNYEPESSTCRIRNVSSNDHHDNADGVNYFASPARSPTSSSVCSDEGTCKQFIAAVLEAPYSHILMGV